MIYLREEYRMNPAKIKEFNQLFHDYVLPLKIKSGARLIGSWVTDDNNEITVIWEYPNREEYIKIEQRVKKDKMYQQLQIQPQKSGSLYSEYRKSFLTSNCSYTIPKQIVTVSGYITNEAKETLLVKTQWRSDTWELPGGGVDEGETLDQALIREILEETGIRVKLFGVSGVYSNGNTVTIVFLGKAAGGELTTSVETTEVSFVKINETNLSQYIKRGKFIPRVKDAMKGYCVPYEAFKVRPYQLLERFKGNEE
ncbi:NUDIX domain-containing protein [Neobacillus mesonae]|uniref:NUDIX hydrolase n=1 Tax=Neobacillus mesonae TaxID=1193713 RepID=A0A3Q9QV10_9BACI|nr:NUDIX domain-containing protein [Neobacillus mesonae]AZU62889.1 NUDIX hydrolase [Neobacillus mesonae]